ncbi:MAG: hypothetical protein HQL96_15460 [Magnetococcales bacterium]|nr:hypothetical protein [Magnetococcales bacterium]
MKGFLAEIGKRGGTLLLVMGLAPIQVACAHTIDPTQNYMPTYEMPAAVVVQTTPAPLQLAPWQQPVPGAGINANYASYPSVQGAAGAAPAGSPVVASPPSGGVTASPPPAGSGYPPGSTVVRQAPITIERPSIVVNQPPLWVGNPPVAVPQPPVVMHQPPVTVEQPSFVIQPPRVGYQPTPGIANVVENKATTPEPKVSAPQATAETKAVSKAKKAKAKKAKHKATKKKPAKQAARKSMAPDANLPPK